MTSAIRRGLLVAVAAGVAASGALGVSGGDTITTVAGNGIAGSSGDGGQATSAELSAPWGIAVDGHGNVYVGDRQNSRVRELSGGILTTVAGTGTPGYSGDGGQATSAQLDEPEGVALDSQGNLYVADYENNRVREISGGVITTFAGTGTRGFSGDGGPATSAQLNRPVGLAFDAQGDLYIADSSNQRVRKVSGGIITTVAGNGAGGFSGDGGQATSAQIDYPEGVAVDAQGNLFIADTSNHRLREVSGGIITTVAGTGTPGFSGDGGPATAAQLDYPEDVTFDGGGKMYIADASNNRIRTVSGGIISTIAGTGPASFAGDGGPATAAQLYYPISLAIGPDGSLYVADWGNERVRKIENKLPTASFAASPASGQAPLTVSFDASASNDADGRITAYVWTFGDGATGGGATADHQYTAPGTYTAKLTVTDDSGAIVSATRTITVSPPPPLPTLKASKLNAGRAQAGRPFTVSMTVTNARTGKGVKGRVSCAARLAGKSLATSHRSSSASGRVSCTWLLPKSAHDKQFKGSIADTYEGVTVSRPFSTKVI